ncbi:hypothetical protein G6F57_014064 [Rhizopus arrhizus]|uniref:Uncharacterized protein n=1 Tax=Rhizopus oryzae TaxID=64495 RepID=A0A9P6WXD7_RHIOR|nr:hypothetical protein G6F23_011421 [Rhizopus arrhizus]KAG1397014.1 hypothetical protein G6F58_011602 [Rhizopus delemar]KAG0753798.1 hypothetical protein G6F24_012785 [Rhizopus arrhizus]KAG0778482.1 hypothetical protein G6F22_011208 [Rhizopus arrhizus]KAG0779786.1 hypothetical protein G6F21_012426 [Rhizopus arrhizus]
MAKIEDNKRRSSDTDEQGVSIRPPPKKRFMTQQSSTDDQEDVEESADTFKEPLEAFRKEAILRQWKDYLVICIVNRVLFRNASSFLY